ncbi:MAG TPA: hypothetical protein VKV69_05610 [Actinomycetota bacterium]|nr:hypothetical protein [Actinomycetota bacterium]
MTLVGPTSWFLFLIILLFLKKSRVGPSHEVLWVIIVVVLGVASLVGVSIVRRQLLRTTDSLEIASGYVSRYFLAWAIGESPALIGFVGFFDGEQLAVYLTGVAFALVTFALNAPTRARIESEQAKLRRDQHSSVNLLDALLIPSDQLPPRRSR